MNTQITHEEVYEDPDKYFGTTDINLAAALITAGFPVVALKKQDESTVVFIFDKSDELKKERSRYWMDELELNPRMLFNNKRSLRTRIRTEIQ